MSGFAKGMIIAGIAMVILLVLGIAGLAYWISRQSGPLLAKSTQAMDEGRRFGASTDNEGCVSEMLVRYKREPGFSGAVTSRLFLDECLRISRTTKGFCDDVPTQTEFTKTVKWQLQQCARAGLSGDSYCGQLFNPIQSYCELQRTGSK
jgi:hypothetical protein